MRKLIYGALAMVTALGLAAGVNPTAASASVSVKFDAENQTLAVDGAKSYFAVSFPTVKEKDGKLNVTAKSWDTYEAEKGTVDLSKLNPSKTGYVAVKDGSSDKAVLYVLNAETAKKLKATYTAPTNTDKDSLKATAVLEVKADDTVKALVTDTSKKEVGVSYRTAYGKWTAFTTDTSIDQYIQEGAQLILRENGEALSSATDGDKAVVGSGFSETAKVIGTLPSKEIKVKIVAQGNAPALTIDYKKGYVSVAKKAEYRLNAYQASSTWVPGSDTAKTTFLPETGTTADKAGGSTIQARYKADTSKKKAPSKIATLTVPTIAPTPEVTPGVKSKTDGYTGNDILGYVQQEATAGDVLILKKLPGSTKELTATDGVLVKIADKKTTFTNKTSVSVDVIAVTGESTKVTTIKAGKSANITYKADTKLYIRTSAVAKDTFNSDGTAKDVAAFASQQAPLGNMVKAYTPSPAPSSAAN
jgi:hypothetical protein